MTEHFEPAASIDEVLCTELLDQRPRRAPDHERENEALTALAQALAGPPATMLQRVVEIAKDVSQSGSAGISLLPEEERGSSFRWMAIAGEWSSFLGRSMPRDDSPCGLVVDRNSVALFARPERHYRDLPSAESSGPLLLMDSKRPIVEALLTPIHLEGRAAGTLWLISHDEARRFDAEDARLLISLGRFASAASQMHVALERAEQQKRQWLTERRRSEDALRDADRRKDEFLAMLAHELRNPLAPMRNALQVLSIRADSDPAVVPAREIIERQVKHLTRMVDDLLEVGRAVRGPIVMHPERLDVVRLVRTAVEDQLATFAQAGLALNLDVPELPIWVMADPTRLTQVIDNLLQNSLKFTEPGGRVWVSLAVQDGQAEFVVSDTGVGIEPDVLPHIFEVFTQADRSLARSQGGLGLGLALARMLVEQHGGEIRAFSSGSRQGAQFVVRLPIIPEPPALSEMPAEPQAAGKPLRILVIEDNRDAADSLRMLLEMFGHEVRVAYNGTNGVRAAGSWQPDIVLCDIGLPGLDGYRVAKELREQGVTDHARLIALTGYGADEDRRRSQQAGFQAHLTKPVDPLTLQYLLATFAR